MCQILVVLLLQLAKFLCVHHKRARFSNVQMCSPGSVTQFILLEWLLRLPTVINVKRFIKTDSPIRVCSSRFLDRNDIKQSSFGDHVIRNVQR